MLRDGFLRIQGGSVVEGSGGSSRRMRMIGSSEELISLQQIDEAPDHRLLEITAAAAAPAVDKSKICNSLASDILVCLGLSACTYVCLCMSVCLLPYLCICMCACLCVSLCFLFLLSPWNVRLR